MGLELSNKHLTKAILQYQGQGENFLKLLEWYMIFGRVLCMPEILCLVRECDSATPYNREPLETDALFIEYLSCDNGAIHHLWDIRDRMEKQYDMVCYFRGFKHQSTLTLPYERLRNLLNRSHGNG